MIYANLNHPFKGKCLCATASVIALGIVLGGKAQSASITPSYIHMNTGTHTVLQKPCQIPVEAGTWSKDNDQA